MARLEQLRVRGFRSFGAECQTIDFTGPLTVVWGPNSQGKTSLAEAIEFLFVGRIGRRHALASSKDEFADSLRNVHLSSEAEVSVEATVIDDSGAVRELRRELLADYGKRLDCESDLRLDGNPATEESLSAFGSMISEPPHSAPVLMQHNLGELISARPQDRSRYFKRLLEVTDLDEFSDMLKEVISELPGSTGSETLAKFRALSSFEAYAQPLEGLAAAPDPAELVDALSTVLGVAIRDAGECPEGGFEPRVDQLSRLQAAREASVFPTSLLDATGGVVRADVAEDAWNALEGFVACRVGIDGDASRLLGILDAVLALPAVESASDAVDCPVCETPLGLTRQRRASIREQLENTEAYTAASVSAAATVASLIGRIEEVSRNAQAACPQFFNRTVAERNEQGFSVLTLGRLLPEDGTPVYRAWVESMRRVARCRHVLLRCCAAASTLLRGMTNDIRLLQDVAPVRAVWTAIEAGADRLRAALCEHAANREALEPYIQTAVASELGTQGWADVVEVAGACRAICAELTAQDAARRLEVECRAATRAVERGKRQVLAGKFGVLSDEVRQWWGRLRPEEPTFFSKLGPRPRAKRNIDFKAGLSPSGDHRDADTEFRDVVAVFSQSQLHCLGLATFLARAVTSGTGFVVLDDPVLSSDKDHQKHFVHDAVNSLVGQGVQLIVLTQDEATKKDLADLYRHLGVTAHQLMVDDPRAGTQIEKTEDVLSALLARAAPYTKSQRPELRKEASSILRDAAERFCKELIVKNRRATGEPSAKLSDHTGSLGTLEPEVLPLLTKSRGDAGKLTVIRRDLNPGTHDDEVPSQAAVKVALGNLRRFVRDYLRT